VCVEERLSFRPWPGCVPPATVGLYLREAVSVGGWVGWWWVSVIVCRQCVLGFLWRHDSSLGGNPHSSRTRMKRLPRWVCVRVLEGVCVWVLWLPVPVRVAVFVGELRRLWAWASVGT
jgi:hypothetical protein